MNFQHQGLAVLWQTGQTGAGTHIEHRPLIHPGEDGQAVEQLAAHHDGLITDRGQVVGAVPSNQEPKVRE